MIRLRKSTASQVVMFKAYLASDHVTEATGKTIAITISKNGGAFGNPNAGVTNATEISNGWYKVTFDATDTNTVGSFGMRGTNVDIDTVGFPIFVDPVPGIQKNTALPAFTFPMYDATGNLVTGDAITATRSIDGAAYGSCTNAATEIGTTGTYKIDLSAGDLNGDIIALKFTSTNAKPTTITIKTNI